MSHLLQAAAIRMSCLGLLAGCGPDVPAPSAEWDSRSAPKADPSRPGGPIDAGKTTSNEDPAETDPDTRSDPPTSDASSSSPAANDATRPSVRDAAADPGAVAGEDPVFLGMEICSSGAFWRGGNEESPLMRPGYACVACHRGEGEEEEEEEEEAPIYSIAGTIYLTGHEADDCNGVDGVGNQVQVEVVDATGRTTRLPVNRAGNFFTTARFNFPVLTKVLYQGRERVMEGEVSAADGDCNTCHTSEGREDAPGRIALP